MSERQPKPTVATSANVQTGEKEGEDPKRFNGWNPDRILSAMSLTWQQKSPHHLKPYTRRRAIWVDGAFWQKAHTRFHEASHEQTAIYDHGREGSRPKIEGMTPKEPT
ncbi:hypothetical protein Nepgr_021427 [Nepenthes gracilis]|uniref:Uncharacterized protein n=1 Tax=Nepenthes gracilis TaxID=150966 RepID=A0AAD3SZ14_NEPGR|nr:hypothetical protein Nepgr_021427 [Nepenthes gracilis]